MLGDEMAKSKKAAAEPIGVGFKAPDGLTLPISSKLATSLKARAMLTLAYGCGLRAGEVVRLSFSSTMMSPT
jgi:integrase